jgi:hypothetical protein
MTIIQFPSHAVAEPFVCPIGVALWQEYRRRNPKAPKVPPENLMEYTDPRMTAYVAHVNSCDDCNEV